MWQQGMRGGLGALCEGVQSAVSLKRTQCIRDVLVAAKTYDKIQKRMEKQRWSGEAISSTSNLNTGSSAALEPGVSLDTATGTRFNALAFVLCVGISTAGCGTWGVTGMKLHAKPNVIIGAIGTRNWKWKKREEWKCGVGVRGGLRHCANLKKARVKAECSGVVTDRRTLMAQCGQREPG